MLTKNLANQQKFPNWTWTNHSKPDSYSKVSKGNTHALSSFYHVLDMNTEPGK